MIASRNHATENAVSEELIPIGDVAKEFGVTSTTVKRWVWRKILNVALITPSGRMRFHPQDIQKFKLANTARHLGRLPEPPGPEETVEGKIETFLENMMITHSHLVWRPARKRRYDPFDRLRDDPALSALATAERNRQAKLNDDTIQAVTGSTRKELYEEMSANSVAAVAERMGATETKLREFCSWFRIPIPNERATSVPKRKRLGRRSRREDPTT
jgi:hypothetical protein